MDSSSVQKHHQTNTDAQTIKELFAGSVGGAVQVLTGQPFDTVKVRLQTQSKQNPLYSGIGDCVSKTYRNEGFLGFYKGTLTPLLGIGACVSIQFGALEAVKRLFVFDNISHNKPATLSSLQLFLAGAASGTANSVLSGPIEHVRTRLQVQTGSARGSMYLGPLDFIRKVYSEHGLRGIYKGQSITLVREFFGYGMYFMAYEWLIQRELEQTKMKRNQVPIWKQMMYGAAAGYSLWMTVYPVDVIKSKIQTDGFSGESRKYASSLDCLKKTIKADGVSGLFRGFGACMLRAAPVNAMTFVAYEVTMNMIGR